jgi:putative NADH-flavin reductase
MRLLLYGATGMIGQRILAEAVERGHAVTAAARNPTRVQELPGVTLRRGDVLDGDSVAGIAEGHDAILSAVGPGHGGDPNFLVEAARVLIAASERTGARLVVLGGAACKQDEPGLLPSATTDFAATWEGLVPAHRDALELYRSAPANVDWAYVSPVATVELGKRTGRYRTGGEQLVVDEQGRSRISAEDLAAAILDEVEQPRHRRECFTVTQCSPRDRFRNE